LATASQRFKFNTIAPAVFGQAQKDCCSKASEISGTRARCVGVLVGNKRQKFDDDQRLPKGAVLEAEADATPPFLQDSA